MIEPFQMANKLSHYYVVKTVWRCLNCRQIAGFFTSTKIQVFWTGPNGVTGHLSYRTLIERYERIYGVTFEEATSRAPKLPLKVEVIEQDVEFCADCMPSSMGSDDREHEYPIFVPNQLPLPDKSLSNLAKEINREAGIGQGKKNKKKSRRIHPRGRSANRPFTLDDL